MSRAVWTLLARVNRRGAELAGGVPTDAELLARFTRDSDAAAFELIVWRHGGLVLGACTRMLRDRHAAEDAFQATFLILAKNARGIRPAAPLAGWLYAVARRVCLRLKKRVAIATVSALEWPTPESADPVDASECRAILDAEIARLPEKLRLAVVLCYLQGRTAEESATILRIPRGTVLSRLDAARKKLKVRLLHRGIAPAAAAGTFLTSRVADALPTSELVLGSCRLGTACLNGTLLTPTPASLLAYEVLAVNPRIAFAATVLILCAGLGTGFGLFADGGEPPKSGSIPLVTPKVGEKKPVDNPKKPRDFTATEVMVELKKPYPDETVAVTSRIASIATHTPSLGTILVSTAKLPNGDYFGVALSDNVVADLKRLGISDLDKHFNGGDVKVEGKLTMMVYLSFPAHEMIYIKIDSLDQIRAVTREAPTEKIGK